MNWLGTLHSKYIYESRVAALVERLVKMIPNDAQVVDVGCGDGLISQRIVRARNDLSVCGIDVLIRPDLHIPVVWFDGKRLPLADQSADIVMFIDVLHHSDEPNRLLREALRVSRGGIIIKDHLTGNWLAEMRLRLMDFIGNARHGVALPYNYWSKRQWRDAFCQLNVTTSSWEEQLALYPWWASWAFDGSLHFIAHLETRPATPARVDRID